MTCASALASWGSAADAHYTTLYEMKFGGGVVSSKKIAVISLLCAVVVLTACRREERYEPLKLGGPVAEEPAK